MADIVIVCPGCGNRVTVSEYVAAAALTCAKCSASIPVPVREPQSPRSAGLKLSGESTADLAPDVPAAEPRPRGFFRRRAAGRPTGSANAPLETVLTAPRHRKAHKHSNYIWYRVWPWLLFVVIAVVFAWLRHGSTPMLPCSRATVILVAVWSLVALHVSIILHAFNDDGFDGVLCTIIPGYTLYYLFWKTNQHFFQALVAATLLVFGKDASLAAHRVWGCVYRDVTAWIQGNDTFKKDVPR